MAKTLTVRLIAAILGCKLTLTTCSLLHTCKLIQFRPTHCPKKRIITNYVSETERC
jgi:hypothetical protein